MNDKTTTAPGKAPRKVSARDIGHTTYAWGAGPKASKPTPIALTEGWGMTPFQRQQQRAALGLAGKEGA